MFQFPVPYSYRHMAQQVEELKGRLRTIMASAQTPDLLPAAGPGAGPQQGGGRAGPAGLEQLAQAFMAALQGSAGVVPMGASGSGNVDAGGGCGVLLAQGHGS